MIHQHGMFFLYLLFLMIIKILIFHYQNSAASSFDALVKSYSTCCETPDGDVTFECKAYWSAGTTDASISITCDQNTDEFMTSCSGVYVNNYTYFYILSIQINVFVVGQSSGM